jgi:hypothetical protein
LSNKITTVFIENKKAPSVAGACSFSPKNSQATSFSFVTFLLAMKKKSKPRR